MLYEEVELGLCLDRRCHMVVVGEWHPLLDAPFAERGHLVGVGFDLVLGELRLGGERSRPVALNRAGGLAVDDAGCAGGFEEGYLLGDPVLLRRNLAVEQQAREPAATDADVVLRQDRAQDRRIHWEAAACLHAREAGHTRLAKALLEADVVAQLCEVVVPPGDRRNAQLRFHALTPQRAASHGSRPASPG